MNKTIDEVGQDVLEPADWAPWAADYHEASVKLKQEALVEIPRVVASLAVTSDEEAATATSVLQRINGAIGRVEAFFKKSKAATYAAWKSVCADENTLKAEPLRCKVVVQGRLDAFLTERRKERDEAEAKQREGEERERRRLAEVQVKARLDQDAALAEAARLEMEGKKAEAAKMIEIAVKTDSEFVRPFVLPSAILPLPVVKTAGAAERKVWWGEVDNFKLVPDYFKMIDQGKVDAYARTHREEANAPGLVFRWKIASAIGRN